MVITKVHPSLNDLCGITKNISNSILAKLNSTVESLDEEKQKRLDKVIISYAVVSVFIWVKLIVKACHLGFCKTDILTMS